MNKKEKLTASTADRHLLYEASVQCTEASIDIIDTAYKAVHGRKPRSLREDFCGTAKLCADWARQGPKRTAVGLDIDGDTLDWAALNNIRSLSRRVRKRVRLVQTDVLDWVGGSFDVIAAFNFSYWVFHDREVLRRYFSKVLKSLSNGGFFIIDLYGGPDSQYVMEEETEYEDFTYVWDQDYFDPINNHIICHIHFRFPGGGEITRAFTYDWRIWSMPELRDLLKEVGFSRVDAWWDGEDDVVRPAKSAENLISWVAYLAAWK